MSHHCHDEHCDHDHSDLPESGEQASLYGRIDLDNARCLNAVKESNIKKVIRPWHERLDTTEYLESDADEQLIIYVPFTGNVKLRSICLRTDRSNAAPSTMKVFTNSEDIDFDNVEEGRKPVQTWELTKEADGVVEYATSLTKFSSVRNITLYFPENFGADTSVIHFLGFKGEWTQITRDPIITVYEANANPADHKIPGADNKMDHSIQ